MKSLVFALMLACSTTLFSQNYQNLTCWGYGGTSCFDMITGMCSAMRQPSTMLPGIIAPTMCSWASGH